LERLEDLFVLKFNRESSRIRLGLGFSTSHNIVQRHGGSINVKSRVGEGTCVSVILPLTMPMGI
jgi:signal transduction histidine kinase